MGIIMTRRGRGRVTRRTQFGSVMRWLAVPAVLLCAIGSANAQTSGPVDDGRAAPAAPATPQEAPNTGTATTEAPKTDAPKPEPPAEPQAQGTSSTFDGFKVGGFTFKPGGRIKLDIIRDFSAITSEDSLRHPHDRRGRQRRQQLATSTRRRHACPSTYAARSKAKS